MNNLVFFLFCIRENKEAASLHFCFFIPIHEITDDAHFYCYCKRCSTRLWVVGQIYHMGEKRQEVVEEEITITQTALWYSLVSSVRRAPETVTTPNHFDLFYYAAWAFPSMCFTMMCVRDVMSILDGSAGWFVVRSGPVLTGLCFGHHLEPVGLDRPLVVVASVWTSAEPKTLRTLRINVCWRKFLSLLEGRHIASDSLRRLMLLLQPATRGRWRWFGETIQNVW